MISLWTPLPYVSFCSPLTRTRVSWTRRHPGGRVRGSCRRRSENVPPRAADVVVVQLHPHDDAEHIALTLRARTRCDVLIALVSFRLKIDAGIFDHVALVPLMPPDLVKVICSLTPC